MDGIFNVDGHGPKRVAAVPAWRVLGVLQNAKLQKEELTFSCGVGCSLSPLKLEELGH